MVHNGACIPFGLCRKLAPFKEAISISVGSISVEEKYIDTTDDNENEDDDPLVGSHK
jgi:hypothetical protein